jgi:small subunit ribosomal protein S19e
MADVKTIEAHKYNKSLAEALKSIPELKEPEWASFVKTGVNKERPTAEPDFWYIRTASVLRQIYIHNVVGTQRLRTRYGGKKNRGGKPSKFKKSGGKIIRTILQQAEAAGLVEKVKGKKSGRKLTDKGKQLLEENANDKTLSKKS